LSSLELATIRGDIDDTEFKRHDLEQEEIVVLEMQQQQQRQLKAGLYLCP
jgi:hypothetical protein